MKIEKLPSGNYRIRKQINGKRRTLTFDHKPTKKEIDELIRQMDFNSVDQKFEQAAEVYLESKSHILSPSTIRGYRKDIRMISDDFKSLSLDKINQLTLQQEVNRLAEDHSAKTVRNVHGLISAILRQFNPNMIINTTLPQKQRTEPYIPSDDDVRAILEYLEDDEFYILVALGCYGLRLSEALALTMEDVHEDYVDITKAMVKGDNEEFVIKNSVKTDASYRRAFISPILASKIRQQGFVYSGSPNNVNRRLHAVQRKLGIEQFSYHKLRHYFASRMSTLTDDATVMAMGGWSSDTVLKQIYRHSLNDNSKRSELAQQMGDIFLHNS